MKTPKQILPKLLTAVALLSGATALGADRPETHTANNRVIYEVFVRNFSSEGTLKGVEAQIPRLKDLGVDVVWLMPIYPGGQEGKWDDYPSPYAVRDYTAIDPDYGTDDDLHSLVNTIHSNGMEIWLDWVANHTAKDHPWVNSHREYYGNNPYSPNGWNDVYQLDYSCEGLRVEMIDALKYWVREFDIDGYRCDYAEGVALDFWERARSEVNAVKDIAWLAESGAEGEHNQLVKNAFDYTYAWGYHTNLMNFVKWMNVDDLRRCSYDLIYNADGVAHNGKSRMVYLSNHDIVQENGTEDRIFGSNVAPLTVLQFTVYGMPLIYNGQEIGYSSGQISIGKKTPIDWSDPDNERTALIRKLAWLKHTEPALNTSSESADLINHTSTDNNVYVYERRRGSESVVVMLNFGDNATTFTVTSQLPAATFNDTFTGATADFTTECTFSLPAKGYAVYTKGEGSGEIIPPVEPETYTITFRRPSSWTNTPNVHVYYSTGSGSDVDLISNQPMTSVAGTTDLFEYPFTNARNGYNVMFNNGGWGNGQSANSFYEPQAGNYTYTLDSGLNVVRDSGQGTDPDPVDPTEKRYVYISNQTGWDNLHLYAWTTNGPEIFGSWPGIASSGTKVINDVEYLCFEIPESAWEQTYNLIINNGKKDGEQGKQQLTDQVVALTSNIFIVATLSGTTVDIASIVDDIPEAPAEFYNLQGQRIQNPSNGIYIRRRGAKVDKIIIR